MDSAAADKPHAVCVPYPAQGHITPMLNLAKILHSKGFHITFVNTEYNHRRLLRSQGSSALDRLPDFRFEAITDGLPPSDDDATQDITALCISTMKNCLAPFRGLLSRLNDPSSDGPPVTCIIADAITTFALDAAEELGVPGTCFWTSSVSCLLCSAHLQDLIDRDIIPLKSMDDLYTHTVIDWLPGLDAIRLKHLPSGALTTDIHDPLLNFVLHGIRRLQMASCILLNTFDDFDRAVLDGLSPMLPPLYTIGPLHLLSNNTAKSSLEFVGSNLWKEQPGCLDWLQGRKPRSVVYVNFGSITVMANEHLIEFAWGLANSAYDFLWVIRPDLVKDESAVLPHELLTAIEGRSLLASWCPQEQVLHHPSVGGFLTHCGLNSILESISSAVPMICWPFFADQHINCHYLCNKWGVGLEIDADVKREKVERMVRELMDGEKGKEMRSRALEWKELAVRATQEGGTSFQNIEKLAEEVLLLAGKTK